MTSSTPEVSLTARLAQLDISAEQNQPTRVVFAQKVTTAQEAQAMVLTPALLVPMETGRLVRETSMSAYLVLQAITAQKALAIQHQRPKAITPHLQVCQAWSLYIYALKSSIAPTQA